jgi:hypothetical protein
MGGALQKFELRSILTRRILQCRKQFLVYRDLTHDPTLEGPLEGQPRPVWIFQLRGPGRGAVQASRPCLLSWPHNAAPVFSGGESCTVHGVLWAPRGPWAAQGDEAHPARALDWESGDLGLPQLLVCTGDLGHLSCPCASVSSRAEWKF